WPGLGPVRARRPRHNGTGWDFHITWTCPISGRCGLSGTFPFPPLLDSLFGNEQTIPACAWSTARVGQGRRGGARKHTRGDWDAAALSRVARTAGQDASPQGIREDNYGVEVGGIRGFPKAVPGAKGGMVLAKLAPWRPVPHLQRRGRFRQADQRI